MFLYRVTLKVDGLAWKQWDTPPEEHQALCIISSSCVNWNWIYGPEMAELGFDFCDLNLWPLTLTFCMENTFGIGNNSWKLYDDEMKRA